MRSDRSCLSLRLAPLALVGLLTAGPVPDAFAQTPPEMLFQFDQNGTPSLHTFRLKWATADSSLQTIEILVSETQEVIQSIVMPTEGVRLIHQELAGSRPDTLKDKIVEYLDYNFDKFGDLRLVRQWPYRAGEKAYFVWLFDPDKNQYVINEEISALPGPVPNSITRRIETTALGGLAGFEYVKRAFSINATGRIKVQTKITQSAIDQKKHYFLRDVRTRVGGEMQRICKILVPSEGKPRRTWGRKTACEPYIYKDLAEAHEKS